MLKKCKKVLDCVLLQITQTGNLQNINLQPEYTMTELMRKTAKKTTSKELMQK